MDERDSEREPDEGADCEAGQRLLRGEPRLVEEDRDQRRPVDVCGLAERLE